MKKFLIFVALVFALYSGRKYLDERGFERESRSFVTQALKAIAKNWSIEDFRTFAAPRFILNKDAVKVFADYHKLGRLTGEPDCKLEDYTSYKYPRTTAVYKALTYRCEVRFENAPATIQLIIFRFQDKSPWKIDYFTLHSPLFKSASKGEAVK